MDSAVPCGFSADSVEPPSAKSNAHCINFLLLHKFDQRNTVVDDGSSHPL